MKKFKSRSVSTACITKEPAPIKQLYSTISGLIERTYANVASDLNTRMIELYWCIGTEIIKNILQDSRAEYGKQIVESLGEKLALSYGRGFSRRNLFNMVRFAEVFPAFEIVHTVCTILKWSHLREIIYIQDELKRSFYLEMCRIEKWSVRRLQAQIQSMLYERMAISKNIADLQIRLEDFQANYTRDRHCICKVKASSSIFVETKIIRV